MPVDLGLVKAENERPVKSRKRAEVEDADFAEVVDVDRLHFGPWQLARSQPDALPLVGFDAFPFSQLRQVRRRVTSRGQNE